MTTHPGLEFEYKGWKINITPVESYGLSAGRCEVWHKQATKEKHVISKKSSYLCSTQTLQWEVDWIKSDIDNYEKELEEHNQIKI